MQIIISFIVGMLLGITIFSGITQLVRYIVGKCFGEKLYSFMYLFFTIRKINNEKTFTFGTFSPICQLIMLKKEQTDEEAYKIVIISRAISTIICILYWFSLLVLLPGETLTNLLFSFLLGLGIWYTLIEIYMVYMTISFLKTPNKILSTRTIYMAKQLIQGISVNDIDVPDYRELGLKCTKAEIVSYQNFAFMKRIWHDDFRDIHDIAKSIEYNLDLNSHGYLLRLTHGYYNLIFYYSCIATNEYKAHRIFDIVSKELVTDTDANGLRVLAYYTYYVEKNSGLAKTYIEEAYRQLSKMTVVGEQAYEEKLILRLIETIDNFSAIS